MNSNTSPPIDKDPQTNPSGRPPLSEKDFIRNGTLASLPFWVWIFLTVAAVAIIWGSRGWYEGFLQKEKSHDPFLEVTNREFSVFLWQFPSYMRVNAPKKSGYLTGFVAGKENFSPDTAEEFVSAPPDLIFLYHTWHRLLANESKEAMIRSISSQEFTDFLEQLPEWNPSNWKRAPKDYVQLIESKSYTQVENLQSLPISSFPLNVRQAFLGWKNYYIDGSKINDLHATFGEIKTFLDNHPHYARNFWRNIGEIDGQNVAGLDYLSGYVNGTFIPDATVPAEQIPSFLKVALYNSYQK